MAIVLPAFVKATLGVIGFLWLLASAYFVTIFVMRKIKLRAFRGPLAIPVLGNTYSLEALSFMRYISTLRKKYGKIFTFWAFTKPYLVSVNDVDNFDYNVLT